MKHHFIATSQGSLIRGIIALIIGGLAVLRRKEQLPARNNPTK